MKMDTKFFSFLTILSVIVFINFSICINDPNIPAVTLKCRYLKDFEQSETELAAPGNQTEKCGTNRANQNTYYMSTGYATTTFKENSATMKVTYKLFVFISVLSVIVFALPAITQTASTSPATTLQVLETTSTSTTTTTNIVSISTTKVPSTTTTTEDLLTTTTELPTTSTTKATTTILTTKLTTATSKTTASTTTSFTEADTTTTTTEAGTTTTKEADISTTITEAGTTTTTKEADISTTTTEAGTTTTTTEAGTTTTEAGTTTTTTEANTTTTKEADISTTTTEAGTTTTTTEFGTTTTTAEADTTTTTALSTISTTTEDEDWSCETSSGTPCSGSMVMASASSGWRIAYLKGSVWLTCWDSSRKKSNTGGWTSTAANNGEVTMRSGCFGGSCITAFKVCLMDPNVPAVTLECKYLKNFMQTGNNDHSSNSQNVKCGANGAKQNSYAMNTGYGTTTIQYNCEQIYIEKPATDNKHKRK